MAVGNTITGVGQKFLPVTAAVGALGTAAVKTTADFDSSMSQVQATIGITKDSVSDLNGASVNTMDSLGVSVYDSEGNMRSMNDILGDS